MLSLKITEATQEIIACQAVDIKDIQVNFFFKKASYFKKNDAFNDKTADQNSSS